MVLLEVLKGLNTWKENPSLKENNFFWTKLKFTVNKKEKVTNSDAKD